MTKAAIHAIILLMLISGCKHQNESKNVSTAAPKTAAMSDTSDISIYEAALNGYITRFSEALERTGDINMKDADGRTPLMYAAFNGHSSIMQMLLDKGAMVNIRDVNGRTALMLASSGPYPSAVKMLLDHNADPNLADNEEHWTALMFAAAEGHLDVVKILIQGNADPSIKDADGDNALVFARNNGHKEVADFLGSYVK